MAAAGGRRPFIPDPRTRPKRRGRPPGAPLAKRIAAGDAKGLPTARVLEFQALSDYHRFDPMEVPATAEELRRLVAGRPGKVCLLFPEDRRFPIRMNDELPLRWIRSGPSDSFRGEACRNEFYAFQIGLYAAGRELKNVRVSFSPLKSGAHAIPAEALQCFNAGGVDYAGNPLVRVINVPQGGVQPLWIGVDVPHDAAPGVYKGQVTIAAEGSPQSVVSVNLSVVDKVLDDRGDSEPWRHSRLRWLNSKIAIDDEVFGRYTPVAVDGRTVGILGRRDAHFRRRPAGQRAVDIRPVSRHARSAAARDSGRGDEVGVRDRRRPDCLDPRGAALVSHGPGAVVWETESKADGLSLLCSMKIECDGWITCHLTLSAQRPTKLKDVALEIPLRRDAAKFMMGLGRKGGLRLSEWTWNPALSLNSLWLGDLGAGLYFKGWGYHTQPPQDGGCSIVERGDRVGVAPDARPAHAGRRRQLPLNFNIMITPTKLLDKRHWQWRYYHVPGRPRAGRRRRGDDHERASRQSDQPLHQLSFPGVDKLSALVSDAHSKNLKLKIYYTLRELSCRATELWACAAWATRSSIPAPASRRSPCRPTRRRPAIWCPTTKIP